MEGVRTEQLAQWAAGHPHVWTRRTITVAKIVDTRYVVTFDGRSDVRGGTYAYDGKDTAWRAVQWMMTTPDAIGDHPAWERIYDPRTAQGPASESTSPSE